MLAPSAQAAGSADLRVAQSINPTRPQVGQDISYQVLIANRGPDTATNVRLVDALPEGATVTSMPSFCSRNGATIVCTPGSIPANGAGSVVIVLRASLSGLFGNRTQVSSGETDPVPSDNDTTTTITISEPPPPGIDPPRFSASVDAKPAGTVLARPPGASAFTRVTRAASFPLGTIFDARHGSVRIYSQLQTGEVQAADFFGGQFQVLQSSGAGGLTEIKLVGGNFASCRVRSAAAIGRSVRHLWADGRGQFRTRGRYATAGIRGTKWLTDDRCGGTLIRVTKGAVTVRDLPRRRTVVLRAPGTYVARARR